LGLAEGSGFGFAEGAEFASAALDDGARDFVRKRSGFGPGTLRKRKNVEIGEGARFDEGERGSMVVFGFSWEAGDHIGADGGMREAFMNEFDAAGVMLRAIPAVHAGKDAVGAGLQRHVKMLSDAVGGSKKSDKVLGNVERLDGADAETFDGSFLNNAAEEVFEFDTGGKVAAVSAEIDATENDFAGRQRQRCGLGVDRQECLSHREALDFPNDFRGRQATALAADERDDTVGAAGVTTVLNFESRAGVIPFSAADGGGEKFGAVEDVAGEDLAKMERNIPSAALGIKLWPYKGMERNCRVGMQC